MQWRGKKRMGNPKSSFKPSAVERSQPLSLSLVVLFARGRLGRETFPLLSDCDLLRFVFDHFFVPFLALIFSSLTSFFVYIFNYVVTRLASKAVALISSEKTQRTQIGNCITNDHITSTVISPNWSIFFTDIFPGCCTRTRHGIDHTTPSRSSSHFSDCPFPFS